MQELKADNVEGSQEVFHYTTLRAIGAFDWMHGLCACWGLFSLFVGAVRGSSCINL